MYLTEIYISSDIPHFMKTSDNNRKVNEIR